MIHRPYPQGSVAREFMDLVYQVRDSDLPHEKKMELWMELQLRASPLIKEGLDRLKPQIPATEYAELERQYQEVLKTTKKDMH